MTKLRREDDPRSLLNDQRMTELMKDADKRIDATVQRVRADPKVRALRTELREGADAARKRRGAA